MFVLPLPMIVSILLFLLVLRAVWKQDNQNSLLALIGLCALQSAVIALHHYYGFGAFKFVQPFLAMLIPPLAWYALSRASDMQFGLPQIALHSVGPLLILSAIAFNPDPLDYLIPIAFTAYGIAILIRLAAGEDNLPNSKLESGSLPLLAWRGLAVSLFASAACDVFVAWSIMHGTGETSIKIVSLISSLTLFTLGALSFAYASQSQDEPQHESTKPSEDSIARDQAIIAKLDDLMNRQKPYLDPDLTLSRLGRKITVPAKDLSAAINRVKSENVSRYINRLRINHACDLLRSGTNVTSAMLDSGFQTKSNFNREFLRVLNKSPSAWLASAGPARLEKEAAGNQPAA